MRAGMLRHRVTIQRYELVVDDYGAPLHRESWKDVATVWAFLGNLEPRYMTRSGKTWRRSGLRWKP